MIDGRCQEDPAFMQLNCLKACRFCATMQPHAEYGKKGETECKDLLQPEACRELAEEMECNLNPTYMVVNCRATCGKCPGNVNNTLSSNIEKQYSGIPNVCNEETLIIIAFLMLGLLILIPKNSILRKGSQSKENKKTT